MDEERYLATGRESRIEGEELLQVFKDSGKRQRKSDRPRPVLHAGRQKAWVRKKMAEDPTWRVQIYLQIQWKKRCRSRGIYHAEPFLQLLGCEWSQFIARIEHQLKRNGWTWQRYGSEWTLDHKLPVRAWNLERYEERAMCSHFSNLRPLSDEENRRKNGSYSKAELRCYKTHWRSTFGRQLRQALLFKQSRGERKPICPF